MIPRLLEPHLLTLATRLFLLCLMLWAGGRVPFAMAAEGQEPPPWEGATLTTIDVQGNDKVEDAAVLQALGLSPGSRLFRSALQQAVRNVWNLRHFRDVQVDAVWTADGQVSLTFLVAEKSSIREVALKGNNKLSTTDLGEALDVKPFAIYDESKVRSTRKKIEDLYLDKGFYLARVDYEVKEDGNNEVTVTFNIDEGRKVLIKEIRFVGNDHVPASLIKRYFQTGEAGLLPGAGAKGTYKEDQLQADVDLVQYVYAEQGYLNAKAQKPLVALTPDRRWVTVTIHVTEGPRYRVGELKVTGDLGTHTEEELKKKILHKSGTWFRLSQMQSTTELLTQVFSNEGYAFCTVAPQPVPHPETGIVDIVFDVDRGEKVYLDEIRISGNDTTWDKVIRREIHLDEGSLFRGKEVDEARRRLERLGYFEKVEITTPRGGAENTLDMEVRVTEKPTGTFSVGAGFSNAQSFIFTANISKNNFLGLGLLMSLAANISLGQNLKENGFFNGDNRSQQYRFDLYDPYFLDTRTTARFSVFNVVQDYGLAEYNRGFTLAVGKYLDRNDDVRIGLDYTFEDLGLSSLREYQQRYQGGDFYRSGRTSSLTGNFVIDKRNNRISPTKGLYFSTSLEFAGGFRLNDDEVLNLLGGDFRYLKFQGNFRSYVPLVKDLVVLRWNLSGGFITSLDGTQIPYSLRYRAGGINSLRGFSPYSVGPDTSWLVNDDPVHSAQRIVLGGLGSLISNLEIEYPLIPPAGVKGVVFFDAGGAFGGVDEDGEPIPFRIEDMRTSVGFGVRWNSPMGPLRFEWGFPLNRRPYEKPLIFEFTIGSFF